MSAVGSPAHGLAAMFGTPEALVSALRHLRDGGYSQLEAYAPWPLEEARALVSHGRSRIPLIMLAGGLCGFAGALVLQAWAASDYPLNVAGRPIFSWPAFVPVTFELTVLTASLLGLMGFLVIARLPRLDHPMFGHSAFGRASQDAFFICVRASDPKYDVRDTLALLLTLGAEMIEEVRE